MRQPAKNILTLVGSLVVSPSAEQLQTCEMTFIQLQLTEHLDSVRILLSQAEVEIDGAPQERRHTRAAIDSGQLEFTYLALSEVHAGLLPSRGRNRGHTTSWSKH